MEAKEAIRQLKRKNFQHIRMWLYALDPREAMLLACDPKFRKFLDAKRAKSK